MGLLAFAINPRSGSEPGVAFAWLRQYLERGHSVHVFAPTESVEAIERGLLPVGASCEVTGIPKPGERRGPFAPYREYRAWLSSAEAVVRRYDFDLFHHVTYGNLFLGTIPARAESCVFGPVGGGQVMDVRHLPHLDGGRVFEAARSTLVRSRFGSSVPPSETVLALCSNRDTLYAARSLGYTQPRLMLADGVSREVVATTGASRYTRPTLVWVGRFLPRKAASLAIRAFADALAIKPDAQVLFAGDGPTRDRAQELASRLLPEDAYTFLGHVQHDEVFDLLHRAHGHLFTSVRDSFGGQVLEAAAGGTPSIALSQSGIGTFYPPEAGVLVSPKGDLVQGFSNAIVELLSMDDPSRHEMSTANVRFALENTWDAKYETLLRLVRAS